jgi:hypothetical protein
MPDENVVLTGKFLGVDVEYQYRYQLQTLDGDYVYWILYTGRGAAWTPVVLPNPLPYFTGFKTPDRNTYLRTINWDGSTDVPIKYERILYYLWYSYKNPKWEEIKKWFTHKYSGDVTVLPEPTHTW